MLAAKFRKKCGSCSGLIVPDGLTLKYMTAEFSPVLEEDQDNFPASTIAGKKSLVPIKLVS